MREGVHSPLQPRVLCDQRGRPDRLPARPRPAPRGGRADHESKDAGGPRGVRLAAGVPGVRAQARRRGCRPRLRSHPSQDHQDHRQHHDQLPEAGQGRGGQGAHRQGYPRTGSRRPQAIPRRRPTQPIRWILRQAGPGRRRVHRRVRASGGWTRRFRV